MWLSFIDLGLNKSNLNFYKIIKKLITSKKNFFQDSQDLWNGDRKEERWDRKKMI